MIAFNIHTGEIVEQITCGQDEREITTSIYPLFDYKENYIGYIYDQDKGHLFINAGSNHPSPDPNETIEEGYARYLVEKS